MFSIYKVITLIVLGITSSAFSICPQETLAKFESPRQVESRQFKHAERMEGWTRFLTHLTDRPHSATQTHLRKIAVKVDLLLYLGDTGNLINEFSSSVRGVEAAYRRQKKALDIIKSIQLAGDNRYLLDGVLRSNGEIDRPAERVLKDGTYQDLIKLRDQKIKSLQKEITISEKQIGLSFLEFRTVLRHLDSIIQGSPAHLLGVLNRVENPSSVGSSYFPGTSKKTGFARIEEAIETLYAVEALIYADKPVDKPEIIAKIKRVGLLDEKLKLAVERLSEDANRIDLAEELHAMAEKLTSSRDLYDQAVTLRKTLGLLPSDFNLHPNLFVNDYKGQPTKEQIEESYYRSRISLQANRLQDLRREIFALVDSTLFYGFLSGVVPTLGRTANAVTLFKSEAPRIFVYNLFSGLYEKNVTEKHLPALLLLQRASGDTAKMTFVLEALNAGTKDELLITFARRADLKDLWMRINEAAAKSKDTDPHQLFNRMEKAEQIARDLGTISLISNTSYARYILSTICNLAGAAAIMNLSTSAAETVIDQIPGNDSTSGVTTDDKTTEAILTDVKELLELLKKVDVTDEERERVNPLIERLMKRENSRKESVLIRSEEP